MVYTDLAVSARSMSFPSQIFFSMYWESTWGGQISHCQKYPVDVRLSIPWALKHWNYKILLNYNLFVFSRYIFRINSFFCPYGLSLTHPFICSILDTMRPCPSWMWQYLQINKIPYQLCLLLWLFPPLTATSLHNIWLHAHT